MTTTATTHAPLFAAACVQQDQLGELSLHQLAEVIRSGARGLNQKVADVRRLASLNDEESYQKAKAQLPFFIGACFSPAVRRKENFVRIDYLVLDIDHLRQETGQDPETLKQELAADRRVLMAFVSPGGQGLKVLLHLETPCFDPHQYKQVFLGVAGQFAETYALGQAMDRRTNDVTRICFLSHDPQLYYNPDAEPLDWQAYLPTETEAPLFSPDPQSAPAQSSSEKPPQPDVAPAKGPTEEQYTQIKAQLNPNAQPAKKKQYYIPDEVVMVEGMIGEMAQEKGLALQETRPVNYGKKLVFTHGAHWCEINLYYGKNGFKATITPKKGSHNELAETCLLLVNNALEGLHI